MSEAETSASVETGTAAAPSREEARAAAVSGWVAAEQEGGEGTGTEEAAPEGGEAEDAGGNAEVTEGDAPSVTIDSLMELAKAGDAKAVLEALGIKPDASAKAYISLKEKQRRLDAKIASQRQEIERAKGETTQLRGQLETTFSGLSKAAEMRKNGDLAGAAEVLFGMPFDDFLRQATLRNTDPGVAHAKALEEKLAALEEKLAAKERPTQEQTLAQHKEWFRGELSRGSDRVKRAVQANPELADAAMQLHIEHYKTHGRMLPPEAAMTKLLDGIEGTYRALNPEAPSQPRGPGKTVARQAAASPARPKTRDELREEYVAKFMV